MKSSEESIWATWAFVFILIILFLLYSFFAYRFIGDKGHPNWDFGVVEDVPAASPYSVYKKLPYPQHVRGSEGE
jgi:hypothetical protein